jgi:hypothetical protein
MELRGRRMSRKDEPSIEEMACYSRDDLPERLNERSDFSGTDSSRGCEEDKLAHETVVRRGGSIMARGTTKKKRTKERVEEEVVLGRHDGNVPYVRVELLKYTDGLFSR